MKTLAASLRRARRASFRRAGRMVASLLAISNHDFCPWANRYLQWLQMPIGWFVVALAASALAAVFLEPQAWIIFGSLLAVITLGVAWPWVAMQGTTAEIVFNCRRCREGDGVQVRLIIHNHRPWPLWGLAIERGFFLCVDTEGRGPVAALDRVPGWSRSEFVFDFRPDARGVYPIEIPELATGFPFGLWRAAKSISVGRELLVWPRTLPLTSIPSQGGDIVDLIGMLIDRPGHEGDVIGVRRFRQGDRLRSIHWAQTARRDALIVTERQAAARRLVVVAVDVAAFANADAMQSEPVRWQRETAIRVAASIAQEFHAHHTEVRFLLGEVDLLLSPDTSGLHRLQDALARFQFEAAWDRPALPFGHQALAIVVTTPQRRPAWESGVGTKGPLRLVLIDRAGVSTGRAGFSQVRRQFVWITIDSEANAAAQLRHQWERLCHDSLAK